MLSKDYKFQFNSKKRPVDWNPEFDAHIYFTSDQLECASSFKKLMEDSFDHQDVFVGDLIPTTAGPHTLPMFEANFRRDFFADFVLWLMDNRGELSILVHRRTHDDLSDHTVGALWLGKQVPLDYSKF